MKEVIDLTRQLVQIPSTKGNTLPVATLLQTFFAKHGLQAQLNEYSPGEANLWVTIGPSNTETVLVSGHLDVVPAGDPKYWTHPPFSGYLDEKNLWGRGSVDMKGGLAMLAGIMVHLSDQSLQKQILFVATAEEETGLLGAKHFTQTNSFTDQTISHIIIAEPTGLQPLIMEKGVMWLEITCVGKQSHGSRPDLGVNAISELTLLLQEIPDLLPKQEYLDIGGSTMNVTTIEGGSALNVGAESAKATIDLRIPPCVPNTEVQADIQKLLQTRTRGNLRFSMQVLYDEPAIISPSSSLADLLADEVGKKTGRTPTISGAHYTTDGTIFMTSLEEPVPFVIFGPGSPELLHQTDERLDLKQLELGCYVLCNVLSTLCLST